ncbi:NAD(P)/FAD-dependent oxidoreductase [Streptomyces uncialis]|uniref:NAD(P)/FAD-dependent oxidoreductase n=1 Tax=Streptomyces uncialis TaxID=1048205 RepID=UPI00387050FF|nr:FAD-dependent oxidoreductase [Streptomyces uncialis]
MGRTVVVVGGGYGGSAVAKALDEETDVVLIEPRDAFVHAAGALRALVRPDWADNIFFPYDALLKRGTVLRERAVSVDPDGVTLASGERVGADHLVLASGSGYPFPAKTDTDSTQEALARLRATHQELAGAGRVLIEGAGPVGLELAGEIKAVWPDKRVTVVDPGEQLVPGFGSGMRAELRRQLGALGVELRLGTTLTTRPPTGPGLARSFTVGTSGGELQADIWFRCHGVRIDTGYLGPALAGARTSRGLIRVTESLRVDGHRHVHAIGDITDLAEAKMAAHAVRHADVVARNILSQLRGEEPSAVYRPSPVGSILIPLGPELGTGQASSPEGATVLSTETVVRYKGADLATGRFAKLFGTV